MGLPWWSSGRLSFSPTKKKNKKQTLHSNTETKTGYHRQSEGQGCWWKKGNLLFVYPQLFCSLKAANFISSVNCILRFSLCHFYIMCVIYWFHPVVKNFACGHTTHPYLSLQYRLWFGIKKFCLCNSWRKPKCLFLPSSQNLYKQNILRSSL